jgi:hypothetical protein
MAFLPALLLLLTAVWTGTFEGAATAGGAAAAAAAVLALVAWGGQVADPLGLGPRARWLPWLLVLWVAVARWASPVPRAGLVGVVLLPAYVMLPAVVARVWREPVARRRGVWAVAVVVAMVAAWAVVAALLGPGPRASLPLGHHNLMAVWLLAVLPLAFAPAFYGRAGWVLTGVAGGLAAIALFLGGSRAGALGLTAVGFLGAGRRGRGHLQLALAAVVVALAMVAGPDIRDFGRPSGSIAARQVYARAALTGIAERPLTGWGPGATPWTGARHLVPRPGVNPPGEAVGDLHSLPLTLAYELGLLGLALVMTLGYFFGRRHWTEAGAAAASGSWAPLAVTGLAGSAVAALGGAPLTVTALPMAWAVIAGAALAGGAGPPAPPPSSRAGRLAVVLYAVLAAWVLAPLLRAQRHYEVAVEADPLSRVLEELATARALDPAFPLYRARWAWSFEPGEPGYGTAAMEARGAAEAASGVAALWLQAGVMAQAAGQPWGGEALVTACRLDPFGAFAPFHLTAGAPADSAAARWGARAVLLEPRLAGSALWPSRPGLGAAVRREVAAWDGVNLGLRQAVAAALEAAVEAPPGAPAYLTLKLEGEADQPWALHLFRRIPWQAHLAAIEVHGAVAAALPRASERVETAAEAFTAGGCPRTSTGAVENPVEKP